MKKIYLGSDHGGFGLKEQVKKYFDKSGRAYVDLGAKKYQPRDDYPDYAFVVAKKVVKMKSKGILFCRNGIGVAIAANKIKGARAASLNSPRIAQTARADDDTNILCLGADYISPDLAKRTIKVWLKTEFSGKARHKRRINKIRKVERGYKL